MSEAELLTEVLKLCVGMGYPAFHVYDSRYSTGTGFPDLTIVAPGGVIFAELKNQTGWLRKEQTIWRDRLRLAGATWFLWRPADLRSGEIQSVLEHLATEPPVQRPWGFGGIGDLMGEL
jgi:hypothetical protein